MPMKNRKYAQEKPQQQTPNTPAIKPHTPVKMRKKTHEDAQETCNNANTPAKTRKKQPIRQRKITTMQKTSEYAGEKPPKKPSK